MRAHLSFGAKIYRWHMARVRALPMIRVSFTCRCITLNQSQLTYKSAREQTGSLRPQKLTFELLVAEISNL